MFLYQLNCKCFFFLAPSKREEFLNSLVYKHVPQLSILIFFNLVASSPESKKFFFQEANSTSVETKPFHLCYFSSDVSVIA